MREFIGSREAIPRVFLSVGGRSLLRKQAAKFQSTCAKGSEYFCHEGGAAIPAAPEAPTSLVCRSLGGGSRPLFDFGKERLETLTAGVSTFGQPGLEQTQKTKSLVHMHRRVTPRALVRLMRARWEQISEAIGCHWGRQIAATLGNLYVACSALAASTPQRWRSSSSMSAGFSTVWATSSRNNQR